MTTGLVASRVLTTGVVVQVLIGIEIIRVLALDAIITTIILKASNHKVPALTGTKITGILVVVVRPTRIKAVGPTMIEGMAETGMGPIKGPGLLTIDTVRRNFREIN